jgi:hypothetical protein
VYTNEDITRMGPSPPHGPIVDWWVKASANAARTYKPTRTHAHMYDNSMTG